MHHFDHAPRTVSTTSLLTRFDEFPAGCDPDFDDELEPLDRTFAELRLTFNHQ